MKHLKQLLILALLAIIGIGQMRATNPAVGDVIFKEEFGGNNIQASNYTFTGTTTWSGSTTGLSYASSSTNSFLSTQTAGGITSANFFFVASSSSTLTMSGIAIPSNVTSVTVSFQSNKASINCTYSFTGNNDYATGATSVNGTKTFDVDCANKSTLYLKFTKTGTQNARMDNIIVTVKTVSSGLPQPTLSSIAVKTAPTKTTYTEGEYFAPAGLVITKTMSNSSTEDVDYDNHSGDFSFSPTTSTALTTGNNKVTITYGGKSVDQAITVNSAGGGGGSGNTYTLGWGSASGSAGTFTNFTATSGSVTSLLSFSTAKHDELTTPAYNENNSELRLYNNGNNSSSTTNGGSITITPADGITITGFVITAASGYTPTTKYKIGTGSATAVSWNTTTATVSSISCTSASPLTIQNCHTSSQQLRIKTIAITYEVAEPEPATVVLKSNSCGGATFTVSESATRYNHIVYTQSSTADADDAGNSSSDYLFGNGDISISGLEKNTTYYYWVATYESDHYLYSEKANFTTVNGFDIELTASDGNGNTTEATATSCITAGTSVTLTADPTSGYKVSEWTVLDGNSAAISPTSSTATTFTFNMPSSNVMAEATYCALPTAPTGLGYTLNADETRGKTVLSWTAVTGATGYELSYSKDNVAQTPIDVNTNSYTFNPLAVGVYTWSVKAINGCGESAATNGTGFTICPDFSSITPTVGAASSIAQTTATANWTAVAGAAKYTVQVYKGDDKVKEFENETGTSKAITGLTSNTTYVVKVTAYNTCNEASITGVSAAFTTLKQVYTVTLNTNGGTINAGNITSYTETEGATLPTDVTKTGYNFDGWFDNSDLEGDAVNSIATTATGNLTFWAGWSAKSYDLSFNKNADDAEGTMNAVSRVFDAAVALPANTFTRDGYQFMGWATTSDGSKAYDDKASYTMTTEGATLYAVWAPKYTVNWIVNGTTKTTQTAIAGTALTTPYGPVVYDCDNSKVFVGWTETQHYTDATDAPSDLFEYANTLTMPVGGATYYAVFANQDNDDAELTINFESASSAYTAWTFTNFISQHTHSNVTAHGGSYIGSTGGKSTGSLVTKEKIASPASLSLYVSKQSDNETSSTWYIQVSSNGSDWTNVKSQSATSMDRGKWNELSADLSSYSNVYVRLYYDGSTAIRNMDDLVLSYTGITRTNYATDCNTVLPVCEEPTFNVEEGTYTVVKNVTITTGTEGATIYYTIDGSNPATSETKQIYSSAVRVDHTLTLKAVAVKEDYINSTVKSAAYTINLPQCATPTFSVAAGRYTETQSVVLSCETEGADIYYTTDGETPTTESTKYTAAISVATDMTIKAVAIAENTTLSEVASAKYKIVGPGSTLWELVESDASLQEGDIIILADKTNNKTAGAKHSSDGYLLPVTSVFSEDKSEITEVGETTAEFTLGGSAGNWTLTSASGTLGCGSTSNNSLNYTSNSKWAISITNGAASVTTSINTSTVYIKYNSGSPRFGSYTTTGTINVYRKTVICVDPVTELAFASSVPTAIDASEKAQLATTGGNGNMVTYSVISNNANAASIDNQNKFSAVVAGTYTVQARQAVSNDFKCAQTTTIDIVVTVAATGVELNKTELSLEEGQFETLVATVKPNDASNKAVTWSVTEGSAYVEVDANGKVTGKAVGSGVVQVKTEDGEFTATCAVTVTPPTPVLTLTATNPLAFDNVEPNLTKDLTVNLKGSYLVANATYSIEGDNVFTVETELDNDVIGSEDGQTLTIRFAPIAEGDKSATITFTSGVASQTLIVTGIGKKRYTATLHAGNGSVTSETIQESSIGSGITLPEATLSQTLQDGGWSFVGWSETELINETAEVPTTINAGAYAITADKELYAVYTRSNIVKKTASKNSSFATSETYVEAGKPIKTTCSNGSGESDHIRVYANATLTVSGNGTTIKRIEFTIVSGYKASDLTVNTGTLTGAVWEGSASSVVFTATKQVRVSSIAVTYQTSQGLYTTYPAELYTIEFDVNGGSGDFSEQTVTKGSSYTLDGTEPTKQFFTFDGWSDGETTYAANGTISNVQNVITLTAQWIEVSKADVIFKNGETTVQTIANKHQGESYDLIAAPAAEEGTQFIGWRNESTGAVYDASTTDLVMGTPAADSVYVAQWLIITPEPTASVIETADLGNGEWILVTNENQIHTGDVVIIAAKNEGYALGLQHIDGNKCWRTQTAITKASNKISNPSDNVAKLYVQNGYDEGQFCLYDMNTSVKGYLYDPQFGSNNYLATQNAIVKNGSWIITIAADATATIQSAGTEKYLKYNSTSGQERFSCYNTSTNVALYKWVKKITTNTNVSDVTLTDAVIVPEGQTLTIDEASELDNLIVEAGGKVSIAENKTLTVNTFTIESTMASGKSGQLNGATAVNFEASEAYIDITLGAGGTNQQWHAFTVPFPVDVTSGIYDLDGAPLTNEVNYAIMEYFGDERAKGNYGWKKIRTTLVPGTFYIMATDGYRTTYRFKKKAGAALVAANSKDLAKNAVSGDGEDGKDNGWNGVGNPTLMYGKVGYNVYVLNPNPLVYDYELKIANSTNFVVGTPFFIQAADAGTMSMLAASGTANYAPAREKATEIMNVDVTFGNEVYTDHLYISASEDALNEYETGKDLVKMTMSNTPRVGRIFGNAYGHELTMVYAPLSNNQAVYDLSLYAPQAGTYSINVPNDVDATIYLTYEGSIIWDLTASAYEIDLTKGTTEGYGLILRTNAPAVVTGVDQIDAKAGAQKVIIDEHVYILRGGQMYDVNGKMVK